MSDLIVQEEPKEKRCRCGHTGSDDNHPCHGDAYTCRKPATIRFYNSQLVPLAGMQMKFQAEDTWACDACWEKYKVMRAAVEKRMQEQGK